MRLSFGRRNHFRRKSCSIWNSFSGRAFDINYKLWVFCWLCCLMCSLRLIECCLSSCWCEQFLWNCSFKGFLQITGKWLSFLHARWVSHVLCITFMLHRVCRSLDTRVRSVGAQIHAAQANLRLCSISIISMPELCKQKNGFNVVYSFYMFIMLSGCKKTSFFFVGTFLVGQGWYLLIRVGRLWRIRRKPTFSS